jgi:5,10-methylenetetrahydromethanopterin reductase
LSNYCEHVIPIGFVLARPHPQVNNAMDEIIAEAKFAAAAGLGSVWLSQAYDLDPLTALAVIAGQVSDIQLGSSVTITHTRHPITMSSQAQTIQSASGGRLVLGLGVSHRDTIEDRYGRDFNRPARHMREYLSALLPLLREGTVEFHGETLTADTTGFSAHVAGSTKPPVLVAALGPAMLRVAGELADGTITWMAGVRTIDSHITPTISAAASGRRPQVVVILPICVTHQPDAARARAAEYLAIYNDLPSYKAMLDIEHAASPAEVAIIGDERHVELQLRRLVNAGATQVVASTEGFTTSAERQDTINTLAELGKSV